MYHGKTVAVVVPAYNEESQIGIVIDTMPPFVDRIIIVNDCSTDQTEQIVKKYIKNEKSENRIIEYMSKEIEPNLFNYADILATKILMEEENYFHPHTIFNNNATDRIVLINTLKNGKVGTAIGLGYKWCRDHAIDCTAVMAGDAQMDPGELENIIKPVICDEVDYSKGNRLSHKSAKRLIPKKRRIGNSVLSALTKVASGYWRISDTQTGYTAISLNALNLIDLYDIYPTYGCPNDILIKLNIAKCSLREIPIKPVYNVGEKSKMKIKNVIPRVSWLLICGYFKRIVRKYLLNDFHPIFIFFASSWLTFLLTIYFFIYIVKGLIGVGVSVGTYNGFIVMLTTSIISFAFGMWFDMYDNDRLQK